MNTAQHEFDVVVNHLFTQGRQAKTPEGCAYRSVEESGEILSCAVGCRIPDDVYTPEMDISVGSIKNNSIGPGTGLVNLLKRFHSVLPVEIISYRGMFSELQSIHDNCPLNEDQTFDIVCLDSQLKICADRNNLEYSAGKYNVVISKEELEYV
jgi:hypothetical protein